MGVRIICGPGIGKSIFYNDIGQEERERVVFITKKLVITVNKTVLQAFNLMWLLLYFKFIKRGAALYLFGRMITTLNIATRQSMNHSLVLTLQ